jgi:hypothetical protein
VGPYLGATAAVIFWVIVDRVRYTYDHRFIGDNKRHHDADDNNNQGRK